MNASAKTIDLRLGAIVLLVLVAAATRLVPHPYNFSPLGAIALFSGALLTRRWLAIVLPIAAAFVSDLVINNTLYAEYYDSFVWMAEGSGWIYLIYGLIAVLGMFVLHTVSLGRVLGGSLGASILFFIASNFICWPGNPFYAQDLGGLMTCYAAGVPFFPGTVAGDLVYSAALFGGYALLQRYLPELRVVPVRR
ncbi:MAG TPA: hypothetical protein PLN54_10700 [Flavobacteriales bacterium]|nr:hypothetical protein [Flavobacteriales bacterium]